jgi:UDP-glucose 4-epimerase
MKNIIVTGHDGFLGSHLVPELQKKFNVIGVSKTSHNQKITQLKKDICKISYLDFPEKINYIIHLAAITDPIYCQKNPKECFNVNVNGTQNILELARRKDSKIIFFSTSHVYGIPKKLPVKEGDPKHPNSIYSDSKLDAEIICESYSRTYGLDVSIARLFSVYGPNSSSHLVVNSIINQLLKNKVIQLGNVNSRRDFIYVTDVIQAIKIILKTIHGFNDYNVGTGKSYSILEICEILKKISKKNIPVKSIKSKIRKNDLSKIVCDPTKIQNLGWKPKIGISVGLQKMLEWYKNPTN